MDTEGKRDIQLDLIPQALAVDRQRLSAFCWRWNIVELALFGSVVRDDFGPTSDVDVMVRFAPGAGHSLWDFFDMQQELELLVGRPVDLVERGTIRNPFRLRAIERDLKVVYAA